LRWICPDLADLPERGAHHTYVLWFTTSRDSNDEMGEIDVRTLPNPDGLPVDQSGSEVEAGWMSVIRKAIAEGDLTSVGVAG
jgi:hypothetical protein